MSLDRRTFLKSAVGSSALVSLASRPPAFLARAAAAADASRGEGQTVLVVLQLSGGNDGLNTVVPADDDAYGRSRRTLRLSRREVLGIDDQLGFHPSLTGLARLYGEGKLSIVQGVGYAGSDRSHDVALRDWHTALPADSGCQTGWIGRTADEAQRAGTPALPCALVGGIARPLAIVGQRSIVPSLRSVEQLTLTRPAASTAAESAAAAPLGDSPQPADENPLADYVRRCDAESRAGSRKVRDVLRAADSVGEYPDFPLGGELKAVAQLIRAELGIRLFFAELGGGGIGGFDNHANQRDNHAALLGQLSAAVTAFVDDLDGAGLLDRVQLMTFSEFGRTLSENGRRGTDHGAAQPVLLAGGRLRGGLIGAHPSLADLDADAPKPHTDFRRLYATVLEGWLGFDSRSILGARYESLNPFT